ncbi:helix-turn-helix transcriptional regulator [Marininema halotolerans]|uniref:Tetratricopeptide repeat-containing protein n=1 Tax=Marininema halotolerans TaxID=1155944 RepID=A0A1I6RCX9_9BACL|nr:helix-turn-helix transcriptional regulator [Marininema halotolerans]SFS62582.1 Tetratricopeptide repeat-containing protein [Marininema halotolerans]
MEPEKLKDVGEAVRRVRKSKGLRLEDLSDENISSATISNIERGITHVKLSKVYYLVEKLGISTEEIPSLLNDQRDELDEIKFRLSSIETFIEMNGDPSIAIKQLEEIQLEDNDVNFALLQFIKGKAYRYIKNWKQAERCYTLAISLCNHHHDFENIEAISYLDLGMCYYHQNKIEEALIFTNNGLDAFKEVKERKYVKFSLIRNKAVFLERLDRIVEGLKVIQDIWDSMEQIDQTDNVLTLYSIRSYLLQKAGMVDEAIHYANEGLTLARINKHYTSIFRFLIVLGFSYTAKSEWKRAEACFNNSLTYQQILMSEINLRTDTYIGLGKLHLQQGKKEDAKEWFEKAIANSVEHDDDSNLMYALRVMGDYWKRSDNKLKAISYYERALEIARKINDRQAEQKLNFRLSQCYEKIDQMKFEKYLLSIYKTQMELGKEEDGILDGM